MLPALPFRPIGHGATHELFSSYGTRIIPGFSIQLQAVATTDDAVQPRGLGKENRSFSFVCRSILE